MTNSSRGAQESIRSARAMPVTTEVRANPKHDTRSAGSVKGLLRKQNAGSPASNARIAGAIRREGAARGEKAKSKRGLDSMKTSAPTAAIAEGIMTQRITVL